MTTQPNNPQNPGNPWGQQPTPPVSGQSGYTGPAANSAANNETQWLPPQRHATPPQGQTESFSNEWGTPALAGTTTPGDQTAPNLAERQKSKKGFGVGKTIAVVLAVLALLLVGGEFGTRAYIRNEISKQLPPGTNATTSFGNTPLLFSAVTGKMKQFELDMDSTLEIGYTDNDRSRPVVTGQPGANISLRDLDIRNNIVGNMTVRTSVPKEMLLAEAQKGMQQESSAPKGLIENILTEFMTPTDIAPNPQNQTLEFQLGNGIASIFIRPTVANGAMAMQVDSVKVFGQQLPQSATAMLRESLEQNLPGATGDMKIQKVDVTATGMDLTLQGTNVNMEQLGDVAQTRNT